MFTLPAPPLHDPSTSPGAYRRLRDELTSAGLIDGLLQVLMAAARSDKRRTWNPPISFDPQLRGSVLCAGTPLAPLLRLFQELDAVPNVELDGVLSNESIALLERDRVIERKDGATRGLQKLSCWRGLFIFSDHWCDVPDFVIEPMQQTSRVESLFMPLPRHARVVDVGTACGSLALMLRRQYLDAHVVAVDLTERSQAFTRYNFVVNELAQPDLRQTDHSVLDALSEVDFVVFNMPATYYVSAAPAWGFTEDKPGVHTVRATYRSLSGCLSRRGIALVRHEVRAEQLTPERVLEEIGAPTGLDILYMNILPANEEERRAVGDIHAGVAMIRRHDARESRVTLLPVTADERTNYSTRRAWDGILAVPGWENAASVA